MLGERSDQRGLWEADQLYLDLVGRDTSYSLLASLAGRITRKARRLILHLPQGWPWRHQFSYALARLRALPLPS